jgi:hypothetical protein
MSSVTEALSPDVASTGVEALSRKDYEKELRRLHVELVHLQQCRPHGVIANCWRWIRGEQILRSEFRGATTGCLD